MVAEVNARLDCEELGTAGEDERRGGEESKEEENKAMGYMSRLAGEGIASKDVNKAWTTGVRRKMKTRGI